MAPNNTTSHENTTKNITNRRWIHKSDPLINNKNFRYSEKYSCNFQQNLEELKSSGFYYTNISRGEAEEMLTGYNPGSFLLRDSSSAESFFAVTFVTQSMVKKSKNIVFHGKLPVSIEPYRTITFRHCVRTDPKTDSTTARKTNYSFITKSIKARCAIIETYM